MAAARGISLDSPKPDIKIDTREELINALEEAIHQYPKLTIENIHTLLMIGHRSSLVRFSATLGGGDRYSRRRRGRLGYASTSGCGSASTGGSNGRKPRPSGSG
jgi:hypothetical protein